MKLISTRIIEAIKSIDQEQSEGGIYALPERYSKGKWPAGHHHIFGGAYKELDLLSRLGIKGKEQRSGRIDFLSEEGAGFLQFTDIALTKIRPYGNRYQLDRHHGKRWEDCSSELKNTVSRFIKSARNSWSPEIGILVALVYTDSEKHSKDLIMSSIDEPFISRYNLILAHETWTDPHGRGIWTTAVCWASIKDKT